MGRWHVRSDCKQCLGKCSPDDEMKNEFLDIPIPIDETSKDWRFEIIHDMISDKKNPSYRGSQFKSDDAWVIGMYKKNTKIDEIILEFLICYNKYGNKKYYGKLKVEMYECAFRRDKTKSMEMKKIKSAFMKKWEKKFISEGWKKTRKGGTPPPHNSVSVLKFEDDLTKIRDALILAAKSIDENGWL